MLTSPEVKYKGKAAIDTFFWRAGDMLQAVFILAGSHFAFTARDYAVVNIGLVAVWLVLVTAIFREHQQLTK